MQRTAGIALGLMLLAMVIAGGRIQAEPATTNRVTYYVIQGVMYSGQYTHWGAAACSWNYPMGTRLRLPDGFLVTCLDRGHLGSNGWIDIWAPDHATGRWLARQYGDYTSAEIVRWGYG
jgi:hypothetical protein